MKNQMVFIFTIIAAAVISFSCTAQTKISDMNDFKKTTWEALNDNAVRMIGKDWMLITAGNTEDYNMMTASWGSLGWLWEKPVSFIFVRPQRHTYIYTEREDFYTICFFDDKDKEVLKKMGSVSGRDFDKMNYDKLTAIQTENGSVGFAEAYIIIECKKIYATVIEESEFVDIGLVKDKYPSKDFHTMYVGEILNVWIKE